MSTERSIPHLRDVFGLGGYRTPYQQHHSSPTYQVPTHHHSYQQPVDTFSANRQIPQQQQPLPTRPHLHPNNHQYSTEQSATTTSSAIAVKPSSRKNRDNNYKTLTSGDVKTLERHLSMKKTIRKKIMRDLQQAFVDDPTEFKADHNNAERMKSELNMEAFRFGDSAAANNSDNFLVMLRDDQQQHHPSSSHQHQQHQHQNYNSHNISSSGGRAMRNSSANDSSSEYANNYSRDGGSSSAMASSNYYDYEATEGGLREEAKSRGEKPSFWKRFTFKKKTNA